MPAETKVISCPACKHALRVPSDWLGQPVQCPQCQATFAAPRQEGDVLTEAVLLSDSKLAKTPHQKADAALWLPAFALLLLGVVSLVVNTLTLADIATDPAQFEERKKADAAEMAKLFGQDPQAGANNLGANWPTLAVITAWGIVCGAATFAGGLGMALRRWYWLARLGSALAVVNFAGCCCVPGALVGIWSWVLLRTDEGREHVA